MWPSRKLKYKPSKIELKKKSLFWIIISLINLSIVFQGCALLTKTSSTKEHLSHWGIGSNRLFGECRAKARIYIKTSKEDYHGDAYILFHLKGETSDLDITFLDPFRSPYAKLEMDPQHQIYRDSHGVVPLEQNELFQKWSDPHWWQETAFIFGMVVPEAAPQVLKDDVGHPREFDEPHRKVSCDYTTEALPAVCIVSAPDLTTKIKFSSAECSSPL